MSATIITPNGWQQESVLLPEHLEQQRQQQQRQQQQQQQQQRQPSQEEAQAMAQYRQFVASLAFELYSSNIDPGMDERSTKETAGWALESAITFIDAVNGFEL